jgi:hypothetical protein
LNLNLSFMVSDLVYKYHKIRTRGTKIMEWIPDKFVFFNKSMRITPEQEKCISSNLVKINTKTPLKCNFSI